MYKSYVGIQNILNILCYIIYTWFFLF